MESPMDLVILAGGPGKRLGALTRKKHKGVLKFSGKPMLVRLLNQWLKINPIETIWVVTGYRAADVENLLHLKYSKLLASSKIRITRGSSEEVGTLRRLAFALSEGAGEMSGCIVIGVDVLISVRDARAFFKRARKAKSEAVLAVSYNIAQATTHPALRTKGARVIEYLTDKQQRAHPLKGPWLRDTGVRYFSKRTCVRILNVAAQYAYIGDFLASPKTKKQFVRIYTLTRPWIHIATSSDFNLKVPR